jgi:hypothetical protein
MSSTDSFDLNAADRVTIRRPVITEVLLHSRF